MTAVPSSDMALGRLGRRLPLLIFAAGFFTALAMILVGWRAQSFVANTPDPYGFASIAHGLLAGDGFANCGSVLNRRGPLYPAMIALVFLVTGEHPIALQLVQAVMLGAVCALAFDIGRRLFNLRTGVIAGLVCAFDPALLRYVPDFHLETFLTFLCTLTLWRSVVFLERPGPRNGLLFGLFAGLAVLVKPVVLLYPVVFCAWWVGTGLWRRRTRTSAEADRAGPSPLVRQVVAAAAVLAAMGVVILPWTYRNYRASGHFVLVTTGVGDAFLRGFVFSKPEYALLRLPPYTYAENECNAEFAAICQQAGVVWTRDDIETEKILSRAAKEKLRADPAGFLRKFAVQVFTFWYQMTSLTNSLVAGLMAVVLWTLALVGWKRARGAGLASWPLFLPILCLNLSLAMLLALGRYSVPILPALVVMAAFGVDTLLPKHVGGLRDELAPAR